MILTGKAEYRFNYWLEKTHGLYGFNIMPLCCQCAIIQEWFDSVGMHINTFSVNGIYIFSTSWEVTRCVKLVNYNTRNEALKAAINKANEIYNNGNKNRT